MSKSFKNLPVLIKGYFSKLFSWKKYIPQDKKYPCLKSLPAQNLFFLVRGVSDLGGKCSNLNIFLREFEKNLGCDSGHHVGSIHVKNEMPKSHPIVTLKD
jgi:hypothetical protein